jgi:hypothetical protein
MLNLLKLAVHLYIAQLNEGTISSKSSAMKSLRHILKLQILSARMLGGRFACFFVADTVFNAVKGIVEVL